MNRSKTARKLSVTTTALAYPVQMFEDPPGGMPLPKKRTRSKTGRNGQKLAQQDRLRPLARKIDDCVILAHTLDAEGLGDVIALLRVARQNVVMQSTK